MVTNVKSPLYRLVSLPPRISLGLGAAKTSPKVGFVSRPSLKSVVKTGVVLNTEISSNPIPRRPSATKEWEL
jgi:hypothetical protein